MMLALWGGTGVAALRNILQVSPSSGVSRHSGRSIHDRGDNPSLSTPSLGHVFSFSDDPMINVDNIDRTVHRFQPEALKLSEDRDDSSVPCGSARKAGGVCGTSFGTGLPPRCDSRVARLTRFSQRPARAAPPTSSSNGRSEPRSSSMGLRGCLPCARWRT